MLLLADLLAGIEPAIKDRIANNVQYCEARVGCFVDQLLHAGIERPIVVEALKQGVKRASRSEA